MTAPASRKRRAAVFGIALPMCAIVAFIVLFAISLLHLSDIEHNLEIGASPNMLWVSTQARGATQELATTTAHVSQDTPAGMNSKRAIKYSSAA